MRIDRGISHIPINSPSGESIPQEELDALSGSAWQCVGRRKSEKGGFAYRFTLRDEYKEVAADRERFYQLNADHFPANEPGPLAILKFLHPLHERLEDRLFVEFLTSLDYRFDLPHDLANASIELPDVETLQHHLKPYEGTAREFHVRSSTGVASHLQFLDELSKSDVIISSGKEFVHDHLSHVLLMLRILHDNASNPADYLATKESAKNRNKMMVKILTEFEKETHTVYDKIYLRIAQFAASEKVDLMKNLQVLYNYQELNELVLRDVVDRYVFRTPSWKNAMKKDLLDYIQTGLSETERRELGDLNIDTLSSEQINAFLAKAALASYENHYLSAEELSIL